MRFALAILVMIATAIAPAWAYVEAPMPLSALITQSTNVCTMVVTKVDKQKNLIIYKKVADIKGKHPQDEIRHNIGFGGLRPGEWQEIMNWAEVGKVAVFCHNGGASETYIGATWYQAYPGGEWWNMSHGEPFLLRSYSGKPEKLGGIVQELLDGKEVIAPCMVDGDKEALHKKTAKVQRVRCSMKVQDYNPKRDFVGWGGEDIRRLAGMPGFDRLATVGNTGPDALSANAIDFDADGKPDLCIVGANRVLLLQNGGDAFSEVSLPGVRGARAAVWADYNLDGQPDLLLATTTGPKLFTNLGKGQFRDDSILLPKEPAYNLRSAAWLDADGDGNPDLLLANGFHGLRLYRNLRTGGPAPKLPEPTLGSWYAVGPFREGTDGRTNHTATFGPQKEPFAEGKKFKGKRDMEVSWTKADYADGQPVTLAPFGQNCAIYLHRELTMPAAADILVSVGSRDGLTVWVNGEQLHTENKPRALSADQVTLKLPLKAGKNSLLMKLTHPEGEGGFAFRLGAAAGSQPGFEDVSSAWGLTGDGNPAAAKGETLTVADFSGDGRPDILYGTGTGELFLHTGKRFERHANSGIKFAVGKIGPTLCDANNDAAPDLFIPQADGACKLHINDGKGTFRDATATSGDLAKPIPGAVGATWGDLDNDGYADLIVTRLRGSNLYFRNQGDGTFRDNSEAVGLSQKRFNSQAACLADLNGDGRLDLILANEGQESAVLFGSLSIEAKRTPVVVNLAGTTVPVGGRLIVSSADGKPVAQSLLSGADGRGGQSGLTPRFALSPGQYQFDLVTTTGTKTRKAFTVAAEPLSFAWNSNK